MRNIQILILLTLCATCAFAQSKANRRPSDDATKTKISKGESQKVVKQQVPTKKNERAVTNEKATVDDSNQNDSTISSSNFTYEFKKDTFYIKRILINHDASGKGKITFEKQDLNEPIVDPIAVSPTALAKINELLTTLDFINSSENYQTEQLYPQLGEMRFVQKIGEKSRVAEFNYTNNLTARSLADEYRKIGEQAIWLFDMSVSRENQPLESPKLMGRLQNLIKRNQISDPVQLIPKLREFSNDERLPLIARNRAASIVKSIEKQPVAATK